MISQSTLLGNVEITGTNGNVYDFQGTASDVTNNYLPTENIGAGSSFLAYDTTDVYQYSAKDGAWHKL